MGLTVASVVRGPKLQRMIAAEQVVSDCIRQARHTARTSGQPVVLKLKKDERRISGLVRQVLWHGVEGWPLAVPGRTGSGLMVPEAYATGNVLGAPIDIPSLQLASMTPVPELQGGQRLWRGLADPDSRPGLLLSIAVRPPIPKDPRTSGPPTPQLVPLVLVGPDDAEPIFDDALIGIALVQSDVIPGGSGPAPSQPTVAASWEIIGWFGAAANRKEVSSITNAPNDQAALRVLTPIDIVMGTNAVNGFTESGPLTGGRWTEISLLIEEKRMVLYRDGRRVGELTGVDTVQLTPALSTERVFVGCAKIDGVLRMADYAQFDDARLERLGDALAGTMPAGVKFDGDHRIICHPDGRSRMTSMLPQTQTSN